MKKKVAISRFIGLSLSGGKSDKASLVMLEYYEDQKRLFLSRLFDRIKTEESVSADLKIHELIEQHKDQVESVCVDVPLSLPKCIECQLKCPGYESCDVTEMKWLRNFYSEVNKKKKPKKLFTPYTQRCSESYLIHALEEKFEVGHALGSNLGPLAARARFIKRRLPTLTFHEVSPQVCIYRLGLKFKIAKSRLKGTRNQVAGEETRALFLQAMIEKSGIFVYQQDLKHLIEDNHSFEAFICAYMGYLHFIDQTEEKPKGFPPDELWPLIPE